MVLYAGLYHYFLLALILFSIGLWGILSTKNLLKTVVSLGMMLSAIALNFVAFASYGDVNNSLGHIVGLFITILVVFQVVVGVSLLVFTKKSCRSRTSENDF